jgi:signal recognition particle receptor subunit beta
MVFFNYATMQMAAKIVYYGPGLCGKTTNLHHIYAKTSPGSRGEMVSLETETDRTLFFDLLPIDVGVIGGFKTRLQLYTIPGQVFYNTTRKLVLKGVDGLVFVADSQQAMFEANLDSLRNLRENLAEIGLDLQDIPFVLQLNKRDLPNIAPVDALLDALDPERKHEYVEAIASTGVGVFETLKLVSKLTLRTLRHRMTGDEPTRPAARGLADVAQFRIKQGQRSDKTTLERGDAALDDIRELAAEMAPPPDPEPAPEPPPAEPEEVLEPVAAGVGASRPEPQETTPAPASPPVKTVKVRSTIDVMAELEALRKRATQIVTPKGKRDPATTGPNRAVAREIHKAVNLSVSPETLSRSRAMRVTVSFENDEGVVEQQSDKVELGDTSGAGSVSVNLRVDQS